MVFWGIAQRFQGRRALEESMARTHETWKVALAGTALATELGQFTKLPARTP